jgi:hypothetical protein
MAILSIVTNKPGNIGVVPRRVEILSTDDLSTVTTAGYLSNSPSTQVNVILPTDIIDMTYNYNSATNTGTYEEFTPSFSGSVITLVPYVDPGNVLLPVVSGDFANFNGTSGQIKDSGYSPSNAAKTKVVMANGATVANHIMVSTDTAGTSGNLTGTAINDGSIQAGRSGVSGGLFSYPPTASKGTFKFVAADNTGNTDTIITNATMGQATTFTVPDPGVASSNMTVIASALTADHFMKASNAGGVLTDGGFGIYAGTTPTWGGGATQHDFTVTNLPNAALVVATVATATAAGVTVSVAQAISANTLRVIFSVDPGANTTVNWIATLV